MIELTRDLVVRYAAATSDEKVRLADQLTLGQRILLGPMLFDYQCKLYKLILSMSNPRLNEAQLVEKLHAELDAERQREERGMIGDFVEP